MWEQCAVKYGSQSGISRLFTGPPRLVGGLDSNGDDEWVVVGDDHTSCSVNEGETLGGFVGWELPDEGVVDLEEDLDGGGVTVKVHPDLVDVDSYG